MTLGFPGGLYGKKSACNAGDSGSFLGVGNIPWRREWLPTPVFLPREFHGHTQSVIQIMKWIFPVNPTNF